MVYLHRKCNKDLGWHDEVCGCGAIILYKPPSLLSTGTQGSKQQAAVLDPCNNKQHVEV